MKFKNYDANILNPYNCAKGNASRPCDVNTTGMSCVLVLLDNLREGRAEEFCQCRLNRLGGEVIFDASVGK